jgi:pimeloyl-ACP methyl ester carboxylesterase
MPLGLREVAATAFYRGGSGEPMVLLHGITNSWAVWEPVIPALEARHAVFAPTLAGHFGGPSFDGVPVSIGAMADTLERQMDAEGIDRAHLVGNSLGGWLSLELARRGRASSVVGLSPAGGWEQGSAEQREITAYFRRSEVVLRRIRPWIRPMARYRRLRAVALQDMVARPSRVSAPAALAILEAACGCTVLPPMLALADADELFGELGAIECPVRIAIGSSDRLFPRPGYFSRFRRELPDAEWISLEGLGHVPMSDDPARIAQVIQGTAVKP